MARPIKLTCVFVAVAAIAVAALVNEWLNWLISKPASAADNLAQCEPVARTSDHYTVHECKVGPYTTCYVNHSSVSCVRSDD